MQIGEFPGWDRSPVAFMKTRAVSQFEWRFRSLEITITSLLQSILLMSRVGLCMSVHSAVSKLLKSVALTIFLKLSNLHSQNSVLNTAHFQTLIIIIVTTIYMAP